MFVKSNDVILDFCLTLWVSESQKFFATTTFGRHVERLEIVFMAVCGMLFNTRWAPCRECTPKKGINLSEKSLSLS